MAASMEMNNTSDKSLLELDEEALYKQLLLQASENAGGLFGEGGPGPAPQPQDSRLVTPDPGLCIKTRDSQGGKVFINLCQTAEMPAPRDISDEELMQLIDSEEVADYRVPLSIQEPHAEIDNSGNGCTAYDVMVNSSFFEKTERNNLFKGFLMSLILEALEQKYSILLDRGWSQLKNRRSMGALREHRLRSQSKPRIMEMEDPAQSGEVLPTPEGLDAGDNSLPSKTLSKPLITELSEDVKSSKVTGVDGSDSSGADDKGPEPRFTMMREPMEGHPEFLVVEIQLPGVKTAKTLTLDLGEDRLVLQAHPRVYHLDVWLPYDVDQDFSGAQYNRDTQILSLTLPVRPA